MRHSIFALATLAVAGSLLLGGCRKNEAADGTGQLLLGTESHSDGQKTAVDNTSVCWVGGETVTLNGEACTVNVNDKGQAYVSGYAGVGTIRGFYPAGLTATTDTDSPTLTLPSEYASRYADGRQVIALPMAARANEGATAIMFRHVSAAVRVRVMNSTGHPMYLDSVVVANNSYRLCGNAAITLANDALGVEATTTANAADRRVKVTFERHSVGMANEEIRDVQVPILPIGESQLTVTVHAHRWVEGMGCDAATYTFTHSADATPLGRNVMLTAQVKIDPESPRVTTVRRGSFTVNGEGKKVYFTRSNLQYTISTGTWSLMEHAYDIVESGQVGADYASSPTVSLFGWGTNGVAIDGRITSPKATSNENSLYGPAEGDLTQAQDWGHNAIIGAGNTPDQWRTPSGSEWAYVINSRTTGPTVDGKNNAKYAKATVANRKGVILFPDEYEHPDISLTSGKLSSVINKNIAKFDDVVIDVANWIKLEKAGAIFLPAAGQRENQNPSQNNTECNYWSCTCQGDTQSKCVRINGSTNATQGPVSPQFYKDRSIGCSVRLARDAD